MNLVEENYFNHFPSILQKTHPILRSGTATHISGNYSKVCDSSVRKLYEKPFSILMTPV